MAKRILIRLPNWLGDAVMASPAIWEFAETHSDDEITLMGVPLTLSVFQNSPYPLSNLYYDRKGLHSGWKGFINIASQIKNTRFDEAYLLTNSFSSALMTRLAKVSNIIGYGHDGSRLLLTHKKQLPNEAVHQAQHYYFLLNQTVPHSPIPHIYLTDEERQKAQQWLAQQGCNQPTIGMAVGASFGGAKRWYPERYAELARRCIQRLNASIILFGGPDEVEAARFVEEKAGEGCLSIAGKTSLREAFALAHQCGLVVSNDSGMMHVTEAVGTNVVAIIGPTNPQNTGPVGSSHSQINKHVSCAPCLQRECPLGHHVCMDSITTDEVFETVRCLLE